MNDDIAQMLTDKREKERKLIETMKKQLDGMKFNATPDKMADFLDVFDEFCKVKHVTKVQIAIKRKKKHQVSHASIEK